MEIGEYIRTNNGRIGKVIKIWNKEYKYDSTKYLIDWGNGKATYRTAIKDIKHSKNIIDLIQVGDIVNGCEVVAEKYTYIEMNFINIDSEMTYGWGTGAIPENGIKTILTKEQYEQNSYKL